MLLSFLTDRAVACDAFTRCAVACFIMMFYDEGFFSWLELWATGWAVMN